MKGIFKGCGLTLSYWAYTFSRGLVYPQWFWIFVVSLGWVFAMVGCGLTLVLCVCIFWYCAKLPGRRGHRCPSESAWPVERYRSTSPSASIQTLWLRHAELPVCLCHAWLRNLPGDNPTGRIVTGRWETTRFSFRQGLQRLQRLGFAAPGAWDPVGAPSRGQALQPQVGWVWSPYWPLQQRGHTLVDVNVSEATLPKLPARWVGRCRFNRTRSFQVRPRMITCPGQCQVLGSCECAHMTSGVELWLDVRIHTVNPDLPVARELASGVRSHGFTKAWFLWFWSNAAAQLQGYTPFFND